jgi:hypothetical protein
MRRTAGSIIAASGLAILTVLTASVGWAELQRVEAVGIYGIKDSARKRVIPRDEAVAMARWEGVSRVALELIGESAPSDDANEATDDRSAELRAVLGDDVVPYMRSYRILEDRGEVPVLFNEAPDVSVEYVVVVEVLVDVDRVTSALENAGLIAKSDSEIAREVVVVELIGLSRYEALSVVVTALRDQLGATRVSTIEFSKGRQILAVEGPFEPDMLSEKLARLEDPQLDLEAAGVDPVRRRIRLIGRWSADLGAFRPASGSRFYADRTPNRTFQR